MLLLPAGWIRTVEPDHVRVENTVSGATAWAYRERERPCRTPDGLLDEAARRRPLWQPAGEARVEPLVTAEGEYAIVLSAPGIVDGGAAALVLGAVYTDDFQATLESLALDVASAATRLETLRDLLGRIRLALGVRRRRFVFDSPTGYRAHPEGLVTHFDAPSGAGTARITVWPAEPIDLWRETAATILRGDDDARGYEVLARGGPAPMQGGFGLAGAAFEAQIRTPDGREIAHDDVILEDDRFAYVLRLAVTDGFRARRTEGGSPIAASLHAPDSAPRDGSTAFGERAGALVRLNRHARATDARDETTEEEGMTIYEKSADSGRASAGGEIAGGLGCVVAGIAGGVSLPGSTLSGSVPAWASVVAVGLVGVAVLGRLVLSRSQAPRTLEGAVASVEEAMAGRMAVYRVRVAGVVVSVPRADAPGLPSRLTVGAAVRVTVRAYGGEVLRIDPLG